MSEVIDLRDGGGVGGGLREFEQGRVDSVHVAAETKVGEARRRLELPAEGTKADLVANASHWRDVIATIERGDGPLCFGRMDTEDGETYYVGRTHLEVGGDDPIIVVNWRDSKVGRRFRQASGADSQGLARKRTFLLDADAQTILNIAQDSWLPLPDDGNVTAGADGLIDFRTVLLKAFEAERSGQMLDVVATIEAEQDRIIRLPLESTLVVQGGPGTGKTVVGLYRLSYLLYEFDSQVQAGNVMVVGPNRAFLNYVRNVLPSLGDPDVVLKTLDDVARSSLTRAEVTRTRIAVEDSPDVAALKGDGRMAQVIENALLATVKVPEAGISFGYNASSLQLRASDIEREISARLSAGDSLSEIRRHLLDGRKQIESGWVEDQLWTQYVSKLRSWDRAYLKEADRRSFSRALKQPGRVVAALDRMLPRVDPVAFVLTLLSSADRLAAASEGVLTAEEQRLLRTARAPKQRRSWSAADLSLLDEAVSLVRQSQPPDSVRHLVIDEAQDLTAMQARMLGRRCRSGSMTILGDLHQATTAGAVVQSDWSELCTHLAPGRSITVEYLTQSYRVPSEILEVARPLVEGDCASGSPGRLSALRQGGVVLREQTIDLNGEVQSAIEMLSGDGGLVGVIASEERLAHVRTMLSQRNITFAEPPGTDDAPVHLLTPAFAKGLEYDHVVVVEPAEIVASNRGVNALYVALTSQHVSWLSCISNLSPPASVEPGPQVLKPLRHVRRSP